MANVGQLKAMVSVQGMGRFATEMSRAARMIEKTGKSSVGASKQYRAMGRSLSLLNTRLSEINKNRFSTNIRRQAFEAKAAAAIMDRSFKRVLQTSQKIASGQLSRTNMQMFGGPQQLKEAARYLGLQESVVNRIFKTSSGQLRSHQEIVRLLRMEAVLLGRQLVPAKELARTLGRQAARSTSVGLRSAFMPAPEERAKLAQFYRDNIRSTESLRTKFAALGSTFETVGQKMAGVGYRLGIGVTIPLVVLGRTTIGAASKFESSFAGIRKTVEATELEFEKLSNGLRAMAMVIPTPINELNRIGELAGQLGIANADILDFTRTVADLGVTTNLSTESAATSLARFANILQEDLAGVDDKFGRIGSSVVDLGNNFATTEAEIVDFSTRIAASGAIAGLTTGDILGISTALSSVGVRAERGGTAVQKALLRISEAVVTGNSNLERIANVAGMSADQFARAWENNAGRAFVRFVEGINTAGKNVFSTLRDVDLNNERLKQSFFSLAKAGDLLQRAINTGNDAFEANTALTVEAEKRYQTFASQLGIFRNRLNDIGIELGTAFMPVILQMVESTEPLLMGLRKLVESFASLPVVVQKATLTFLGLAAAIGPVGFMGGGLISGIGTLATLMKPGSGKSVIGFTAVAAATDKWTISIGRLAGAVGAVLFVGYELNKWIDSIKKELQASIDDMVKHGKEIQLLREQTSAAIASGDAGRMSIARAKAFVAETDAATRLSIVQKRMADIRAKLTGEEALALHVRSKLDTQLQDLEETETSYKASLASAITQQSRLDEAIHKLTFGVDDASSATRRWTGQNWDAIVAITKKTIALGKTKEAIDDLVGSLRELAPDAPLEVLEHIAAVQVAAEAAADAAAAAEKALTSRDKAQLKWWKELEQAEIKAMKPGLDRLKQREEKNKAALKWWKAIDKAEQDAIKGAMKYAKALAASFAVMDRWDKELASTGSLSVQLQDEYNALQRENLGLVSEHQKSNKDLMQIALQRVGIAGALVTKQDELARAADDYKRLLGIIEDVMGEITEEQKRQLEAALSGQPVQERWLTIMERVAGVLSDSNNSILKMVANLSRAVVEAKRLYDQLQLDWAGKEGPTGAGAAVGAGLGFLSSSGLVSGRTGGSMLGGAMAGFQAGAVIGPQAALIGAAVGAFVGAVTDMMSKTAQTFANGSTEAGRLSGQLLEGSGELAKQTTDIVNTITGTVNGILDSINGAFSSFTTFAVQIRDSSEGIKVWVNDVLKVFGEDVQGAINYAVTEIFKRTEVSGISDVVKGALDNFVGNTVDQLNADLSDALTIENMGLTDFALGLRDETRELGRLLERALYDFNAGAENVLLGPGGFVSTYQDAYNQAFNIQEDQGELTRRRILALKAQVAITIAQLLVMKQQLLAQAEEVKARANAAEAMGEITRFNVEVAEYGAKGLARFANTVGQTGIVAGLSAEVIIKALAAIDQAVVDLEALDFSPEAIQRAVNAAGAAAGGVSSSGPTGDTRTPLDLTEFMKPFHDFLATLTETDLETELRRMREQYTEHIHALEDALSEGDITQDEFDRSWEEIIRSWHENARNFFHEMMDPVEEAVRALGESDLETALRHIGERFDMARQDLQTLFDQGVISAGELASSLALLDQAQAAEVAAELQQLADSIQGMYDSLTGLEGVAGDIQDLMDQYWDFFAQIQELGKLPDGMDLDDVQAFVDATFSQIRELASNFLADVIERGLRARVERTAEGSPERIAAEQALYDFSVRRAEIERLIMVGNLLVLKDILIGAGMWADLADDWQDAFDYASDPSLWVPPQAAADSMKDAANAVASALAPLMVVDWDAWLEALRGYSPGGATPASIGGRLAQLLADLGLTVATSDDPIALLRKQIDGLSRFFEAFGISAEEVEAAFAALALEADGLADALKSAVESSRDIMKELLGSQKTPGALFGAVFSQVQGSDVIKSLLAGGTEFSAEDLEKITEFQRLLLEAGQDAYGGIGVGFSPAADLIKQIHDALEALGLGAGVTSPEESFVNAVDLFTTAVDKWTNETENGEPWTTAFIGSVNDVRDEVFLLRQTNQGISTKVGSIITRLDSASPSGGIM